MYRLNGHKGHIHLGVWPLQLDLPSLRASWAWGLPCQSSVYWLSLVATIVFACARPHLQSISTEVNLTYPWAFELEEAWLRYVSGETEWYEQTVSRAKARMEFAICGSWLEILALSHVTRSTRQSFYALFLRVFQLFLPCVQDTRNECARRIQDRNQSLTSLP